MFGHKMLMSTEAAALAGLGMIQAPILGIGRYLENGTLVEEFTRLSSPIACRVHRSSTSTQPITPSARIYEVDRKCAGTASRMTIRTVRRTRQVRNTIEKGVAFIIGR